MRACKIFLCRCPAAKNEKPPKNGRFIISACFCGRWDIYPQAHSCALWWPVQAASSFFSSPDSYISIMMSEPPINSPFTYSWGMVGHWL